MNNSSESPEAPEVLHDSTWSVRSERGSQFLLRVMTWISLRLGRTISRVVLHLIAAYFLLFSRSASLASRDYLKRVLGRAPTLLDGYKHIFTFASTIHDRIYLINDRHDLFDITIHNEEIIHNILTEGRGAFLVGGHLGSFEVIHAMGRRQPNLHTAMVMFEENAHKLNAMLRAINPAVKQDIIPLGHVDTMLKVHERLSDGTVLSILADRSIRNDKTWTTSFLGTSAAFPIGPFRMAALLRRPVIFMAGLYLGGNRYNIHFEQLADFSSITAADRDTAIQTAIDRYAALLEQYCRSAPYNWFNFFDFWQRPHDSDTTHL